LNGVGGILVNGEIMVGESIFCVSNPTIATYPCGYNTPILYLLDFLFIILTKIAVFLFFSLHLCLYFVQDCRLFIKAVAPNCECTFSV